jgi:hypothetical protein
MSGPLLMLFARISQGAVTRNGPPVLLVARYHEGNAQLHGAVRSSQSNAWAVTEAELTAPGKRVAQGGDEGVASSF